MVLLLRAFIFEPFRIPSDSMMPTLLDGDFIIVNKWIYGLRWPVFNRKFLNIQSPQRGDVVVFRYPVDPSVNYIKRLVGLPGDRIQVTNDRLTVNGKTVPFDIVELKDTLPGIAAIVNILVTNREIEMVVPSKLQSRPRSSVTPRRYCPTLQSHDCL